MTSSQLVVSEVFILTKAVAPRSLDTFQPDETCPGSCLTTWCICAALHPFFDTTGLLSQDPRPKGPFASRSALASMSRCAISQWPSRAAQWRGVQPRGGSIRSGRREWSIRRGETEGEGRGRPQKRVKVLSLKTFRISTECHTTHNCSSLWMPQQRRKPSIGSDGKDSREF